jgi:hypothetical protein
MAGSGKIFRHPPPGSNLLRVHGVVSMFRCPLGWNSVRIKAVDGRMGMIGQRYTHSWFCNKMILREEKKERELTLFTIHSFMSLDKMSDELIQAENRHGEDSSS